MNPSIIMAALAGAASGAVKPKTAASANVIFPIMSGPREQASETRRDNRSLAARKVRAALSLLLPAQTLAPRQSSRIIK